jgi:predicted nucleic acid-binding protein
LVEAGLAELWLPTIVLAELVHLARKQRLAIRLEDLVQDQRLGSVVHIAEIDLPVLREFELLDAPAEIHDRLIVATARILGAPLITADTEIRAGGNIPTVW